MFCYLNPILKSRTGIAAVLMMTSSSFAMAAGVPHVRVAKHAGTSKAKTPHHVSSPLSSRQEESVQVSVRRGVQGDRKSVV